jgi:hypothetical protein
MQALDSTALVEHNARAHGQYSRFPRQIDVLVKGSVAGIAITVVVECKHRSKSVGLGAVDEFIGKLLDVGADRGVMYSFAGFTSPAACRAALSSNPAVIAIALETPPIVAEERGVPGYPADPLVQDFAPQWWEEMDADAFRAFFSDGSWTKWWT